jgi:hypothetical protein
MVHLKQFGTVKVFGTVFKEESRHYILFLPDAAALEACTQP